MRCQPQVIHTKSLRTLRRLSPRSVFVLHVVGQLEELAEEHRDIGTYGTMQKLQCTTDSWLLQRWVKQHLLWSHVFHSACLILSTRENNERKWWRVPQKAPLRAPRQSTSNPSMSGCKTCETCEVLLRIRKVRRARDRMKFTALQ